MINIYPHSHQTEKTKLKEAHVALQSVLQNKALGFHQLPERSQLWESCAEAADLLRAKHSKMVVLGIGGSALGGRVIAEALSFLAHRPVIFLDTIDPIYMDQKINELKADFASTCWALISKSGNTIETLTQADYINQLYEEQNLHWAHHCVVITETKSSPLGDFAKLHKIPRLEIPEDVGGRFSVLTPVGMLPAAFMGLDLNQFRQGAAEALKSTEMITELVAQVEMSFARQEWITVFWSYTHSLRELGYWIQQLWAESLAKKYDRQGHPAPRASTPLPCVGPTDQHSLLQQIAEGAKDKFVLFMRLQSAEEQGSVIRRTLFSSGGELMLDKRLGALLAAEAQATQQGLEKQHVSNMTLHLSKLSEKELGFLFMYFELVVAALGERLQINAFDQPGVELGKVIAKKILAES